MRFAHIHDLPDEIIRLAYSWVAPRISSGEVEYFDCASKAEDRLRELTDKARDVGATIDNLRVWRLDGAWQEIGYLPPQPPRLAAAPLEPGDESRPVCARCHGWADDPRVMHDERRGCYVMPSWMKSDSSAGELPLGGER